jgi:hypothetical protein
VKHLIVIGLTGLTSLFLGNISAAVVYAQTAPANPGPTAPYGGAGNRPNYPYGSRIYPGGRIYVPNGDQVMPSVTVPHGDGSTTYYYPNGTRITVDEGKIDNPNGAVLKPGTPDGGLTNDQLRNTNRNINDNFNRHLNNDLNNPPDLNTRPNRIDILPHNDPFSRPGRFEPY